MEILSRILNIVEDSLVTDPFQFLVYISLLGSFLWLSKELRIQQNEERELQKERLEKSLSAYSLILYEGNTFRTEEGKMDFYRAIYSSIPFIDQKVSSKLLTIIEENISEHDKVQKILEVVKSEVDFLSKFNGSHLIRNKLLTNDVEGVMLKLNKILSPMFTSFFIIYLALLIFTISFSAETHFWMVVKPISFLVVCTVILLSIDLLLERRMNMATAELLLGIFISALMLTWGPEIYLAWTLISLLFFIVLFLVYMYKIRSTVGTS